MSLNDEMDRLASRPEAAWDADVRDLLSRLEAREEPFTMKFWRRFSSDPDFSAIVLRVVLEIIRARNAPAAVSEVRTPLPISREFREACQYMWNRSWLDKAVDDAFDRFDSAMHWLKTAASRSSRRVDRRGTGVQVVVRE